jgi:hypothetical protein
MIIDWTETISQLVHVDVERRTIDATKWLSTLPVWYRAAAAGIVCHWARILELPVVRAGTAAEWILDIRRAAKLLTPPCVSQARARGIIEWRHPADRLSNDPTYGMCWADKVDGTYLCWTGLTNLECLGGYLTTRHLTDVTPLGVAAEDIVAYVHYQCAIRGHSQAL